MPAAHETWMPLYIADYLGDTMHLTTEQHGAYMLLLMAAWKSGGAIPADAQQLAQITRMGDRWQTHAAAIVLPFFTHTDGMLVHARVQRELEAAQANVARKSAAGAAGAAKRWQKDGSRIAPAMPKQSQPHAPSPSPSPSPMGEPPKPPADGPEGFRDFWLAWPPNERKQDKAKCLEHWKRHGLEEQAQAIVQDVRTKRGTLKWADGFIEAPLVYLRGRRWEDGTQPDVQRKPAGKQAAIEAHNAAVAAAFLEGQTHD